ncbi:MAG: MerR family transcriptional regulator [Eubacteriaceae bacterium]|nr:MerR family transcriptional regulator [Eubacteriaceae bacterium]
MEKYLSIGQMAKYNRTTIPTLRYYDKLGLLKPCHIDEQTGYRYYDIKQNARFDLIQYMKELGMALKEIANILEKEDLQLIETTLIKKKEATLQAIENLNYQKNAIHRTIENIDRYRKSPVSGTLTLEYIPERKYYAIDAEINFYNYGIDTYEELLVKLKDHLIQHHIPQVYFCNAGITMRKEDFLKAEFVSDRIFIFVDDHCPLPSPPKIIESGMFACIYLDQFELEKEYAKKLLQFCEHNDYEISGDYICEVLTELNYFDCKERSMFIRLQTPILVK